MANIPSIYLPLIVLEAGYAFPRSLQLHGCTALRYELRHNEAGGRLLEERLLEDGYCWRMVAGGWLLEDGCWRMVTAGGCLLVPGMVNVPRPLSSMSHLFGM